MALLDKPTLAEKRAYRDKHECSVFEAKDALNAQWRADCLKKLLERNASGRGLSDIRAVLADLLALLQSE